MDPLVALAAAQGVHDRYVAIGTLEVTAAEAALGVYQFWLAVLEPGNSQRQIIASQAVLVMRGLAETTCDNRWLDLAIDKGRDVLNTDNVLHNDALLSSVASVLSARSRLTGSPQDADEAIMLRRRAVDACAPDDHDRRAALASNLNLELAARTELMEVLLGGAFLSLLDRIKRYEDHRDPSAVLDEQALAEAQFLYEIAKRETGATPILVANALALLHLYRHRAFGSPADGEDLPIALRIFEGVAAQQPDLLPADLLTGPVGYRGRAEAYLTIRRNAVAATPDGHAMRAQRVDGLVDVLWVLVLTKPTMAQLDELIALCRGASADDEGLAANDLSQALRIRYELTGDDTSLDQAIDIGRRALTAVSPQPLLQSTLRSALISALVTRFKLRWDQRDLDEAIAIGERLLTDHTDSSHLSSAGIAFRLRAEFTGAAQDLDEAVRIAREAITGDGSRPLNRAWELSYLSNALFLRFQRAGAINDLNEAIDAMAEAAEVTLNDANRATFLNGLNAMLQTRFLRSGDPDDLDRALHSGERALALTPPDNPTHTAILSTLFNTLHARFGFTQQKQDFDRAYQAATRLADATTPGHPERALRLSNLASLWTSLFQMSRDSGDLAHAVAAARQAVEISDHTLPRRTTSLFILARALAMSDSAHDLHEAVRLAREVARSTAATSRTRASAARLWAHAAARQADWATAFDGASAAVAIIPALVGHDLIRPDSEHLLAELTGLSGDAAAIAINSVGAQDALRLMEQSRGFLWSRLIELHTDLTLLRLVKPSLAERLDQIRVQLSR